MPGLDEFVVLRELTDALRARAQQLEITRESLHSPAPGVLVGRTTRGDVLRLDVQCYTAEELSR